jgi:hypoxanthine-DNA glycosylase
MEEYCVDDTIATIETYRILQQEQSTFDLTVPYQMELKLADLTIKQEFYGFTGNHFWTILPAILDEPKSNIYKKKLSMMKRNRIALWDVLESCTRPGALDSSITNVVPNQIPRLLKEFPNIRAVFINGQFAYKTFLKYFAEQIKIPVYVLPSTSPANAAMPLQEKIRRWGVIREFL